MANQDWLKWVLENAQTPEGMGRAALAGGTHYDLQRPDVMPRMGMEQTMQQTELQPSEKGNKWLTNFLKVLLPVAGGALMAHEARPPKAPHGGTIGSKPALAQAFQAMSTSLTQKQKAEDLIKSELEKQRHQKVMEDLKRAEVDIKKFLADLNLEKYLTGLPKTEAEIADITEKTRGRKVITDIIEETGYKPGSRGLNIRVGGQQPKAEAVESLDKKIYDLLNKVSYQSPNYSPFNDLQGAQNEQELDVIYGQNVGTLPITELYGGTKANFDALYRYMKERFRKRPVNVPEVEITGELPVVNESDPLGLF